MTGAPIEREDVANRSFERPCPESHDEPVDGMTYYKVPPAVDPLPFRLNQNLEYRIHLQNTQVLHQQLKQVPVLPCKNNMGRPGSSSHSSCTRCSRRNTVATIPTSPCYQAPETTATLLQISVTVAVVVSVAVMVTCIFGVPSVVAADDTLLAGATQ